MNILYIGSSSTFSNSLYRANALIRLGHNVRICDPDFAIPASVKNRLFSAINYRSGFKLFKPFILKWLNEIITGDFKPDLVWVNSGEYFDSKCVDLLRSFKVPVILYNNDDPTGGRDGKRFNLMLEAIPYYDLCVVVRDINVAEFKERKAKKVMRVMMSYDEVMHKPIYSKEDIPSRFRSEVAFIGTWMKNESREKFLVELISEGVDVSIWGNRWDRSPFFNILKPYWRGPSIYGEEYVASIQGAKICLGFLSKYNRDLYTTRSVEIPFAGGLLCAERTSEHLRLFKEGEEAVFWSDSKECATLCKELLNNEEKREKIRLAGIKRVKELNVGNEGVCASIINQVFN